MNTAKIPPSVWSVALGNDGSMAIYPKHVGFGRMTYSAHIVDETGAVVATIPLAGASPAEFARAAAIATRIIGG